MDKTGLIWRRGRHGLKRSVSRVPKSENGVYWGNFDEKQLVNGVTVMAGGFLNNLNYSLIHTRFIGSATSGNVRNFNSFVVTLYHEVQGHNIDDEEEDGNAFTKKYDDSITGAMTKARGKNLCETCNTEPNKGKSISNQLQQFYCDCKVKY